MTAPAAEPRFAVANWGFHAYEITDALRKRHVCAVGLPRSASAANRRPGEIAPAFDAATLAEARALVDVLNAADAAGTLPEPLATGAMPAGPDDELPFSDGNGHPPAPAGAGTNHERGRR